MEEEGNLMVKYIKISEELMNYTNLIKIFNSRNHDGAKMWKFDNNTSHRKLTDDNWEVKVTDNSNGSL